jgi:hypothetical protein
MGAFTTILGFGAGYALGTSRDVVLERGARARRRGDTHAD